MDGCELVLKIDMEHYLTYAIASIWIFNANMSIINIAINLFIAFLIALDSMTVFWNGVTPSIKTNSVSWFWVLRGIIRKPNSEDEIT